MSVSTDLFDQLTASGRRYARAAVRLADGALCPDGLHRWLVEEVGAYRAENPRDDVPDVMAAETVRSVLLYRLRRDAERRAAGWRPGGRHPDRDRLWRHITPLSLAEARRLYWRSGKDRADRFVDPAQIRAYIVAEVAAFRALPGMASPHDEHEDVIESQVAYRVNYRPFRRNKPRELIVWARRADCRATLRRRLHRFLREAPPSGAPAPRGLAYVYLGRDRRGAARIRRVRTGRLSLAQLASPAMEERLAFEQSVEINEHFRLLDRGEGEHVIFNPVPAGLHGEVTPAALRGAAATHRGVDVHARLQALPTLARDIAGDMLGWLPRVAVVVLRDTDIVDRIYVPTAVKATAKSRVERVHAALAVVARSKVGLNVAIHGDRIVVRRAGRRLPADTARLARAVKPYVVPAGMARTRHGLLGTEQGQTALLMFRALHGDGPDQMLALAGMGGALLPPRGDLAPNWWRRYFAITENGGGGDGDWSAFAHARWLAAASGDRSSGLAKLPRVNDTGTPDGYWIWQIGQVLRAVVDGVSTAGGWRHGGHMDDTDVLLAWQFRPLEGKGRPPALDEDEEGLMAASVANAPSLAYVRGADGRRGSGRIDSDASYARAYRALEGMGGRRPKRGTEAALISDAVAKALSLTHGEDPGFLDQDVEAILRDTPSPVTSSRLAPATVAANGRVAHLLVRARVTPIVRSRPRGPDPAAPPARLARLAA